MVPHGEENIVYRAAALLLQKSRVDATGFDIHIHKNIPIGAGLGGGSTDAAATLVGLNRLLKLRLSAATVGKIGVCDWR